MAAIPRFQGQIFIADIAMLLQPLQHGLVGLDVLEWTELANGFAEHFVLGKPQKFVKEWIHIGDASRVKVQNQDAVLGRFEQPAVTEFRGAQRVFCLCLLVFCLRL
jgi:hypothetical protein